MWVGANEGVHWRPDTGVLAVEFQGEGRRGSKPVAGLALVRHRGVVQRAVVFPRHQVGVGYDMRGGARDVSNCAAGARVKVEGQRSM